MKEENFLHTRKPRHRRRLRVVAGGRVSFIATDQSAATGVRRAKRRDSAKRIGADRHSPAQETCLLSRWDGWGLGAEARASEVGSQGDDWGWLRKHSLKGASAPRLARRESGKRSGTAVEARDFFLPLCFLLHKERGLRALLKGAPETVANHGSQRGPQRRA